MMARREERLDRLLHDVPAEDDRPDLHVRATSDLRAQRGELLGVSAPARVHEQPHAAVRLRHDLDDPRHQQRRPPHADRRCDRQ